MKKRFLCLVCMLVFVFSTFKTFTAFAVVEDTKKCNLEITYSKSGKKFENLEVKIHRVAKLLNDDSFEKLDPYSSIPVSIYDVTSNKEWQETALTLESYINADKIEPYKIKKTSKNGVVKFSNIETGLYLVSGVIAKTNTAKYKFDSFLIYLPLSQQDELNYNVKLQPKSSEVIPIEKPVKYKVIKLFKDLGYRYDRPSSVKVDILKNGVVKKTVKLNPSNNWTYSFEAKDDGSIWSVVERNISKKYRVKISKNKTTFVLTNTHKNTENNKRLNYDNSPKTGDTFRVMFYFVTMLISGMAFIIIGVGLLRSNKNEQKK